MRIRTARLQKGLTQAVLAARLGVSVSTFQRWEKGLGLSASGLAKVATELGTSTDYLLERDRGEK